MIVEMRRNGQVIVPKRIAYDLGLQEGDRLAAFADGGVVKFAPGEPDRPAAGERAGSSRWYNAATEDEYENKLMKGEIMYVELRRNLQVIIPRQIASDLNLEVGDLFDVVEEDGVIKLVPVVVYTKAEAERLERLANESRTPGHASGARAAAAPAPAEVVEESGDDAPDEDEAAE